MPAYGWEPQILLGGHVIRPEALARVIGRIARELNAEGAKYHFTDEHAERLVRGQTSHRYNELTANSNLARFMKKRSFDVVLGSIQITAHERNRGTDWLVWFPYHSGVILYLFYEYSNPIRLKHARQRNYH